MRNCWLEKTGTKDPVAWSEKYETPILCMFRDADQAAARRHFQTILASNPEETDARAALLYLQNADFYGRLSDEAERDDAFRRSIIGNYSVMLSDTDAVRQALFQTVNDRVYDWPNNPAVQNQLRRMAEKKYKLTGTDRVLQMIDRMDDSSLRAYLRGKVQNDFEFGLQMLKDEH